MARLRKLVTWFRDAATPPSRKKKTPQHHATVRATAPSRWIHRDVAKRYGVPEDIVRRIYAAVQTAKKQGLYAGHYADLVERSVGHLLVGAEYTVSAEAKKHLGYDPPGGYGGPEPRGSAKAPQRISSEEPKIKEAERLAAAANRVIKGVLERRAKWKWAWEEKAERPLLQEAADELDVAGDLCEEAGAKLRAGTLHERARLARQGKYDLLAVYD